MKPPPAQGIKVLREHEIQERLYGQYLGRRAPARELPKRSASSEAQWTGAEILEGELHRLRSELIALRQEKEKLLKEFSSPRLIARPAFPWRWRGVLALAVLMGGFSLGAKLLGASPALLEPTPYTVQVALYEVRSMAERALQLLQELDYPAFLVESSSRGAARRQFRIYVGRFVTKTEAQQERERLISDPRFADAFVRIR